DTLWDLAIAEVEKRENPDDDDVKPGEVWEKSILFMGNKNGGKTTIILRCLEREESPKPTLALEYTFGRRARRHNTPKDVAHFWELGGGTSLVELIRIPITSHNIRSFAVALVLDLSKPNELWTTMERLLQVTRSHVNKILTKLEKTNPEVAAEIKQRMWNHLQRDHPDYALVDPFPIPLVIIGSKYDIFHVMWTACLLPPKKEKIFPSSSIRGSPIVIPSQSTPKLMIFLMNLENVETQSVSVDPSKPLFIPAGLDSMSQIGPPPASDSDLGKMRANTPLELWKKVFEKTFPPKNFSDLQDTKDPAQDSQYAEYEVDVMRAQKNQVCSQ
ncbi:DC2L1 protein, partial [Horornis vulcanius]|nr:DC2L1 protein [Horornis vulcanius]